MTITTNERIIDMPEVINADGAIFIIPTHSRTISELLPAFQEKKSHMVKSILEANGMEADEDERLIEVWMCSEQLASNNICDHGFHITIGDRKWTAMPGAVTTLLPAKLFEGHREGDHIEIKFPNTVMETNATWGDQDDFEIETVLILRLELAQTKFRYASFGPFEETLRKVGA